MINKVNHAILCLFLIHQDVEELFRTQGGVPEAPDYEDWKEKVKELEGVLDEYDAKLDPKVDIEKEYSNLERLAQETKVS